MHYRSGISGFFLPCLYSLEVLMLCPGSGCLTGDVLGYRSCNRILYCKYLQGHQESLGNFLVRSQVHIPLLVNISLSVQKQLLPGGSIKADLLAATDLQMLDIWLLRIARCLTCSCRLQQRSNQALAPVLLCHALTSVAPRSGSEVLPSHYL